MVIRFITSIAGVWTFRYERSADEAPTISVLGASPPRTDLIGLVLRRGYALKTHSSWQWFAAPACRINRVRKRLGVQLAPPDYETPSSGN